ncbi:MBL fold metallo-hydrolase [Amycolatopsis sp. TRM77291]
MSPIEQLLTAGTFSLDGGTWEVENNVWLVGDEREVLLIDPAHDAAAVAKQVADRRVVAIVCTHAHDDHINQAPALADTFGAPILVHPDEAPLWKLTHPDRLPDRELHHRDVLSAGGVDLRVLVTPGHSPGSVCLHAPELRTVFSGDTLFHGGPGATGRSYSDFGVIIESIRSGLLVLPPETTVCTGHGEQTSIGREAPDLHNWISRGF